MRSGTVTTKLRPLRFAFIVPLGDRASLARALELNAVLWGGTFNPIIPFFKRCPKSWKKGALTHGHTAHEILCGYISAFNPDYLVPLGLAKTSDFTVFPQEVIDDRLLDIDPQSGTPRYGIGIYEVLRGLYDKEFQYTKKYPIKFLIPVAPDRYRSFFSSLFGIPDQTTEANLREHWKEPLAADAPTLDFKNHLEHLSDFNLRRAMKTDIEASGSGRWGRKQGVFLMDASKADDIIDYWNLRAMDWSLLPMAIQSTKVESALNDCWQFIFESTGGKVADEHACFEFTIMKSRSVAEAALQRLANQMIQKSGGDGKPRFSVQHWYPRIWDEWAREKDGVAYCDTRSATETREIPETRDEMTIKTLDPKFAFRFGSDDSGPRFANDVSFSIYGCKGLVAGVIPAGGKEFAREIGRLPAFDEWRFSPRASSCLCAHTEWSIHWAVPKAEAVFSAWMKENGIAIRLSSPGRVAIQMLKHLRGIYGINVLSNPRLIDLLSEMESGIPMTGREFLGRVSRISSHGFARMDRASLLKVYLERKIFCLGVSLKCPTCTRTSWHGIGMLDYDVVCPCCLEPFQIPSHSPDEIRWSYKTTGPFSLPKRAEGVYPTLLTLRVLNEFFLNPSLTPMMSFEATILGREMEVDLGVLLRGHCTRGQTKAVFVECKGENSFTKGDVSKMRLLASRFPGSVLVFATLKEKLSGKEVKLLRPLVNRCRSYYKSDEPYNPILILTHTELFGQMSFGHTWKQKGGDFAKFGDHRYGENQLLTICDATQQIHLGMEPWRESLQKKREAKRMPTVPHSAGRQSKS